ncbi:hypothetical protein CAEBREN_07789 [Caenorhabditis brenneri]|uniref:Uncharacterized protein n=1 Tax=Caenorhabditis brenneri TaxID=135651 RepID=G0NI40_CAEBE|nr:hypothetical protein CAEBREN_07789 [Caenorhabditis brenneri]
MMMMEDSPHIEEIVEVEEAEIEVKRQFEEYKKEIEEVARLPGFNKDSGKMNQVIRIMDKAIEKWEEDEENEGSLEFRRRCLWEFKHRHNNYKKIIEKAEEDFYKRREEAMKMTRDGTAGSYRTQATSSGPRHRAFESDEERDQR